MIDIDPAQTEPMLRTIAMPADTNPRGDIFGGWLLSQMDLAGASAAIQRARGRVVTVAIDAMTFHEPVFVGDELSCYARVARVGRTSIAVDVVGWQWAFSMLALGPASGSWAMWRLQRSSHAERLAGGRG